MNRLSFVLCFSLVVACQPGALDDPGFDLWCGDSLCKWKTEQGTVRRVATWNEEDYGVELVGKPVVLSQLANRDEIGDDPCLQFSLLGNVDASAEVELELDFWNDGSVDFKEAIPGVRWHKLDLLIRLPAQPYDSLKVALHKQASGTAIFALLAANGSNKCGGEPIVLSNLALGLACTQDADCTSGICGDPPSQSTSGTCSECKTNEDCTQGLLCGRSPWSTYSACVPPQTAADGDVCASDEQCVHAHCQNSVCGECVADSDCESGRKCGSVSTLGTRHRACVVPGSAPNSASCMAAEDCASGSCCARVCANATDFCPFSLFPP